MKPFDPHPECPDKCDGLVVTWMRHGDPLCSYRRCQHGDELRQRHTGMTDREIQRDVMEAINARPKDPLDIPQG